MPGSTLRILIGLVLLVHGIGHTMGAMPAFGVGAQLETWTDRSWLLSDILGDTVARWLGVAIWLLAFAGSVAAGLGLLGWLVPYAWWRTLAIVSAAISLVGLGLYWHGFASLFNKLGAIAVDLAVLVGLLALNWPTDGDLGL